jgi:hypothetical protein
MGIKERERRVKVFFYGLFMDEELVVWSFVEHQLSMGGTSYWSPVLYPRREMNDATVAFLLGQSTAFNELQQAISDAFEPPVGGKLFRKP